MKNTIPFVRPVKVPSPYTGDYCSPRIRETVDNSYRTKEAIWICPSTGEFFKRGIVSREPINSPNESAS
jgi:hypothetical protein